jgi:hypothetical protein
MLMAVPRKKAVTFNQHPLPVAVPARLLLPNARPLRIGCRVDLRAAKRPATATRFSPMNSPESISPGRDEFLTFTPEIRKRCD